MWAEEYEIVRMTLGRYHEKTEPRYRTVQLERPWLVLVSAKELSGGIQVQSDHIFQSLKRV